jgi:hypothetical protein
LDADDRTGTKRPYARRLAILVAILVPVLALAGGAAWFVRSYVMPRSVAIAEPGPAAAPSSVATAPQGQPAPAAETTGRTSTASGAAPSRPAQTTPAQTTPAQSSPWPAAPTANWPAAPPARPASVWDSVPLPGPPRPIDNMALAPTEPMQGAAELVQVPLPRARTTSSPPQATVAVPLPRPRPAF